MFGRSKDKSGSGRGGPPLPTVVPDTSRGFLQARQIGAEAATNDYRRVGAVLRSLTDWEDFNFVLPGAFADRSPELAPWVVEWTRAEPNDLLMRTVLGAAHVERAWAIRGSGTRDTVSDEQFDRFWAALREADVVLRGVVQEQPANGAAWRYMFAVAMGLQISAIERRELFERSNRNCPLFVPVCIAYHQAVCEKWGGSFEESIGLARWVSSQLPVGHHGHQLVAEAHFEHAFRQGDPGQSVVPGAIEEVRAALEQSRMASPDWGNDWKGLRAKNAFAIAAWQLGDLDVARHLVSQIGLDPIRVGGSWGYLGGGEGTAYARVGRQLGLW